MSEIKVEYGRECLNQAISILEKMLDECRRSHDSLADENEKLKEEIARLKPQFQYCTMGSVHPDDLPRSLERVAWHPVVVRSDKEERLAARIAELESCIEQQIKEYSKLHDACNHWGAEVTRLNEENERLKLGESLESLLAACGISYFTEGPLHRFTFDTVTVFRCRGKEAFYRPDPGRWVSYTDDTRFHDSRCGAECRCVQYLLPPEPKWRPAMSVDAIRKLECRCRINRVSNWHADRVLIAYDDDINGGPWVTRSKAGYLSVWPMCEVNE